MRMTTVLKRLATAFALLGAAIGLCVAGATVVSVVGRYFASKPIQGDVEITQLGIALCISLCLPWCQWHRANIIVDFFTQRLSHMAISRLDAVGALLVAVMCALLSWRTSVGGLSVYEAQETTMILALPMWWAYVSLAPGLALTAVIALYQSLQLWRGRHPDPAAPEFNDGLTADGPVELTATEGRP